MLRFSSVATRPALLVASLVTEGRKLSLLRNSVLLRVPNTSDHLVTPWADPTPVLPCLAGIPNHWLKGGVWVKKSAAAPPAASAQSARLVDLGTFPRDKLDHRMAERTLLSPGLFSHHTVSKTGPFSSMGPAPLLRKYQTYVEGVR